MPSDTGVKFIGVSDSVTLTVDGFQYVLGKKIADEFAEFSKRSSEVTAYGPFSRDDAPRWASRRMVWR
jgi:hypothetical protein